jgi:hypothetical protein
MIETVIKRLDFLCLTIPPLLEAIDEKDFSVSPAPGKWSKKEILGHLIASATNNHHRIVRGQQERRPRISYDNQVWNEGNHFQKMPGEQVISFWLAYNRHLLELIKHIPESKLINEVETGEEGDKNIVTLAFIIEDYLNHLEYHLHQLVDY